MEISINSLFLSHITAYNGNKSASWMVALLSFFCLLSSVTQVMLLLAQQYIKDLIKLFLYPD